MGVVIFVQTPPGHLPTVDIEGHQEMDDALPLILELPACDLSRGHPLRRSRASHGLDIGLLVHTDHQFPPAVELLHVLIAPQHFSRQPQELCIQARRFQ
jgi:hypothetical protein